MSTVREALAVWEQIDLIREAANLINDNPRLVLELNKAQLYRGEDANGMHFYNYNSVEYATKKHARNPAPGYGVADFFNTGSFYDGFYLRSVTPFIDIFSTDDKARMLDGKAKANGAQIFGLQGSSIDVLAKELHPIIVKRISQKTGCPIK